MNLEPVTTDDERAPKAPCAICNEGFIAGVAKPIEIVVSSWQGLIA